ncbi:hypothetical protein M8C21_004460 [Ambrosia artemisiifolia]|uniref:F-box domain-containing protein n=1 Tax=Ambrosia artemisiifolia TaxID=4212 RepID=A0AAD5G440_AMBAR|nr:hypothetical protein M8C21_004460 [Ambrosia artemisiifolia]
MAQRKSLRIRERAREMLNDDEDDDRISRLPKDVIHHIFSFMDARFVVQSGRLSRSWRNTWKSHPHLNFDISPSRDQTRGSKFSNFVHRFLSMRDEVTELSTINFRSNSINHSLLREIIIYATSHGTRNLKIEFSGVKQTSRGEFDLSLFRSRYLEHLFLSINVELKLNPSLTWDFPALTTLTIECVTFTLQLPNDGGTPKLSSFAYYGVARFSLTANDLLSLNTVNFQLPPSMAAFTGVMNYFSRSSPDVKHEELIVWFLLRERQLTDAFTPRQIGVAECKKIPVMNMVVTFLAAKKMLKLFWAEAIVWTACVLNRCPTKACTDVIPQEKP